MGNADDRGQGAVVEVTYKEEQGRSLSEAILEAIEQYKGEDVTMTDFVLYDDIDPDALDHLFRSSARPRTVVAFTTDGVRVELWGNDGVRITVRDRAGEGLEIDGSTGVGD